MNLIKKLLVLAGILVIFSTVAHAKDTIYHFNVDSHEYVRLYEQIFTGIRDIFKIGDDGGLSTDGVTKGNFYYILNLSFLLGGAIILFQTAVSGSDMNKGVISYGKYIIAVTSLLTLITSSGTSTIEISTNNLEPPCASTGTEIYGTNIDKFPKVLGYTFTTLNEIGRKMTDLVEDYFNPIIGAKLPSAKLSETGGYMGAVRAKLKAYSADFDSLNIDDSNFTKWNELKGFFPISKSLGAYYSQCIFVPYSASPDGTKRIAPLFQSHDLIKTLTQESNSTVKINGVLPGKFKIEYGGAFYDCDVFWGKLKEIFDYLKKTHQWACTVSPEVNSEIAAFVADLNNSTPTVTNFQQTMIQAGMIKSLEDAKESTGAGVNGVSYAAGKSRAEFNQNNISSGIYMSEMLPYFQETIKAILMAFFPLVLIVAILPGGLMIIKNYFSTLLWVELWSPTAAILNSILSLALSSKDSRMLVNRDVGETAINAMNNLDMLSNSATIAGIAGMLYLSVPALTFLILRGSAEMMGGIVTSAGAGMTKNVQTDSIQKDREMVAKTKEARMQSGNFDLSMAEAANLESDIRGTEAGAMLGYKANKSKQSLADTVVHETAQKWSKTQATITALGGGSAASVGEHQGATAGVESAGDTTAKAQEQRTTGVVGPDGKVNEDKFNEVYKITGVESAAQKKAVIKKMDHIARNLGIKNGVQGLSEEGKKDMANFIARAKGGTDFQSAKTANDFIDFEMKTHKGLTETEVQARAAQSAAFEKGSHENRIQAFQAKAMGYTLDKKTGMYVSDTNGDVKVTEGQLRKLMSLTSRQGRADHFNAVKGATEVEKTEQLGTSATDAGNAAGIDNHIKAKVTEGVADKVGIDPQIFAKKSKEIRNTVEETTRNEGDINQAVKDGATDGTGKRIKTDTEQNYYNQVGDPDEITKVEANKKAEEFYTNKFYQDAMPGNIKRAYAGARKKVVGAKTELKKDKYLDTEQESDGAALKKTIDTHDVKAEVKAMGGYVTQRGGLDNDIKDAASWIDGTMANMQLLNDNERLAVGVAYLHDMEQSKIYSKDIAKSVLKVAKRLGKEDEAMQALIEGGYASKDKNGKVTFRDTREEWGSMSDTQKKAVAATFAGNTRGRHVQGGNFNGDTLKYVYKPGETVVAQKTAYYGKSTKGGYGADPSALVAIAAKNNDTAINILRGVNTTSNAINAGANMVSSVTKATVGGKVLGEFAKKGAKKATKELKQNAYKKVLKNVKEFHTKNPEHPNLQYPHSGPTTISIL